MNKTFKYLLLLNNVLFIIIYLILSFNNRLAIDDYFYIQHYNEYGIINGVIEEYKRWSTRYFSILVYYTVLSFSWFKSYLFVYGIITLTAFTFTISYFLKMFNSSFLGYHDFNLTKRINVSILIISALFYTTISIGETWFWLCASTTYLVSMIMMFYGMGALLEKNKSIFNLVILILTFGYIGGSLGPLAIIIIMILGSIYVGSKLNLINIINH